MRSFFTGRISRPQTIIFILLSLVFLGGPIAYLAYRYLNKNQPAVKSISNSNEEHLFVKQRLKLLLNPTHTIDIPHGIGKITLRNRPLSLDEYKLGSSGTPEGEVLNVKTVITYIEHGEPVRLLDLIGVSYKVKVITGSRIVEGYLAKGVGKQSTLKSIMQYR